jgi:hypothetical protein
MAMMIPSIDPATIENEGEREVYIQLRDQLPKHWVARHHYYACWKDGHRIRESEADFILAVPGHGLLFLEVKGSHGYDCSGGTWFRLSKNGTREALGESPFDQAGRIKHRVVGYFAKNLFGVPREEFHGIFGQAVIYPFGKVLGALPSSVDPSLMIAYKHMPHLQDRLEAAFSLWGDAQRAARYNDSVHAKVLAALSESCKLVPVLAADADQDDRKIETVTKSQFASFRGLLSNQRVLVKGTAGSGKTMIALWAANALAEQGKKVLMLCYNRRLAAWLHESNKGRLHFDLCSFFVLCRELVLQAHLPFTPPPEEDERSKDFWGQVAPNLFCQALDQHPESQKYDVVIVDEAQDFHPDWWFPVELLLRDPAAGRLFLFLDPEQAGVYGQGHAYPAQMSAIYELQENCRNTKRIAAYCGNIIAKQIQSFENSPPGVVPEITAAAPALAQRAQEVRAKVTRFLGEGFSPSRIALLSPFASTSPVSALSLLASIGGLKISGREEDLTAWLQAKLLWSSTVKTFKGLEADCLIITDIPQVGTTGFSTSDLYVAASRAKHNLVIIPASVEAESELRAWAAKIK